MKKSKQITYTHGIITLILMIVFGMGLSLPSDDLLISGGEVTPLNENWEIELPQETLHQISLPYKGDVEVGKTYSAIHRFDESLPNGSELMVRASMQDIHVYVNDELIYKNVKPKGRLFELPNASVWHLIVLPEDLTGKTLRIDYQSEEVAFSGVINSINYGTGDALLGNLLRYESPGIFIAAVLMLMGIMIIVISFFLSQVGDLRFLHLGLFAIIVSIWLLSEAKVMQLLTGHRFILGGISYMMVALMPIPLILYIKTAVTKHHHRLFMGIVYVFLIDFFMNIGLQLSGTMGFLESLKLTNAMLLITLVIILVCLFYDFKKYNDLQARRMLNTLGILGVFVGIEIIQFFAQSFMGISLYSRIGLLLFFGILGVDSFKYMNQLLIKKSESDFLKKMVYRDILTGGYNRAAFDRDLSSQKEQPFRLVLCDLNDLKSINDTYGHRVGDQALIHVYDALVAIFGDYGTCYRLSGDEFACIIDPIDKNKIRLLEDALNEKLSLKGVDFPHQLIIAIGSKIYSGGGIDSFFEAVDEAMYDNKHLIKEQSRRAKQSANGNAENRIS